MELRLDNVGRNLLVKRNGKRDRTPGRDQGPYSG
jgi:hypothetical protein